MHKNINLAAILSDISITQHPAFEDVCIKHKMGKNFISEIEKRCEREGRRKKVRKRASWEQKLQSGGKTR